MPPPDGAADSASLYQALILEHFRHPRNRGVLDGAHRTATMKNPLCGDQIEMHVALDDAGGVRAVRFRGEGCSIALATASMMTERVAGKSRPEIDALAGRFARMVQGDADAAGDVELGDLRALAAVARVPARIKCALLPWEALKQAMGGGR